MKTFFLVGFLFCAAFALSAAVEGDRCKNKSECGEDECCLKVLSFAPAKCKKLKNKDERCVIKEESDEAEQNGIHKFACPCAEGLTCKPAKTEDHNGIISYLDETCQ